MNKTPENMIMRNSANKYADMGFAVFPLFEKSKKPCIKNGFKVASADHEQINAWWSVRPYTNIGIACGEMSGGLVVIDIDVDNETGKDGMETLREWEKEHGELPETATVITGSGGIHLYYKTDKEIHTSVNADAGVDIRANGGYIVAPPSIHPDTGRAYEFQDYIADVPVAEANYNVIEFIDSVQKKRDFGERFEVPEEIGKGGRNDTLFKNACSLQEQGYTDRTIREQSHALNQRKCKPPLPDDEVDRIVDSALRYEKGNAAEKREHNKAEAKEPAITTHNGMARKLINDYHACFVDGAPAIWNGVRYATGWFEIDRQAQLLLDSVKTSMKREVREYINVMAERKQASKPSLIAFANGVYDIDDGTMHEYDPDMVITNIIPHEYDPNAYDKTTDDFLNRIACGNKQTRENLEEIIGLCMYRSNDFDTCPVLVGNGSNGKSTYIAALRNVLGIDNVSSLDLNVIGKQFQAVRLLGKLANLGDDISNEFVKGDFLAVFKKIVSGETIYTDVKGSVGFEFKPYCTLVFSCNEFPALGDSSDGMMRRLFPIAFDAQFTRNDEHFDPKIADKLCTPEAARYLVNLGIFGIHRVIRNNGMTINTQSEQIKAEVQMENNSILQWIMDDELTAKSFVGRATQFCYEDYIAWCSFNKIRNPFKQINVTKFIKKRFDLRTASTDHVINGVKKSLKTFFYNN